MAKRQPSDSQILAQIPAAVARARRAQRAEPHANAARYDRRTRTLHVGLTNGSTFSVPVVHIPTLRSASDDDLARVAIGPAGVALRWDTLDADVGVTSLAQAVFGARSLQRVAGAVAGSARTEAKATAARLNGLKGGRPRKATGPGEPRAKRRRR